MIGVDTNVLVRYIEQDDPVQSPLANRVFASLTVENPGFVPLVAIVELNWVLATAYLRSREEIGRAVETVLRTLEIVVENAETVWRALRLFTGSNADFADALVERSAEAAGCEQTLTFDRGAAKTCGMTLIQV